MTDADPIDTVAAIMRDTGIASLAYRSAQGDLVSTPTGTQDFEHPGTVWFLTERGTDKVAAIEAAPRVNVHDAWSDDRETLRELWDASASAWMQGGPDDPQNGLLEVTATSAEHWDSPGAVAVAVQVVKGLVTKEQPELGDDDVVQL
ncbi:pyridoxamine 5'-phosphate oxidase family protein [Agrococcus terreus]|uniref:pyridoxamine 5'-phosphate oxidase family protein n=1 Tax=Agrococcus terreus TaxID=574649 RepID=UPI00384EA71B